MPIFTDNKKISSIYLGSTKIAKIYNGSTLVYQNKRIAVSPDAVSITSAGVASSTVTVTANTDWSIDVY